LFCAVLLVLAVFNSIQMIGKPFAGFRYEPTLTVSASNEGAWNGIKAGLQQFDRILSVDGQEMSTPLQLKQLVRDSAIGTPLRYQVSREGKKAPLSFTIPTQSFTVLDFSKSFLPLFIIAVLHLLVGVGAFWIKPDNTTARAHLLMTGIMSLYCVLANDYDSAMWFPQLYLFSLIALGSAFLHLGLVFPEPRHSIKRHPALQYLAYLPVLLILPIWEATYRPLGMKANPNFELHFTLQNLANLWTLIGLVALVALIVVVQVRGKRPILKQQAKIALMGAAFAYLPGVLLWIVPYLFGTTLDSSGLLVNLLFACFVFFPLSIAYAIVRHKLFDIDVIINRTVVYAIVTAVLSCAYLFIAVGLRVFLGILLGKPHGASFENIMVAENLIATAVVAIAFSPLRSRIQLFVDKLFFRNKYNFRQVISHFNVTARATIDIAGMIDSYSDLVEQNLHPKHLSIFVRDPHSNVLRLHKMSGLPFFRDDVSIPLDSEEIKELLNAGKVAFKPKHSETESLSKMGSLGINLCLPLEIGGEILGLVNFGEKMSELDYTSEDRELLQNMALQLTNSVRVAEMTKNLVQKERMDQELETARAIQASMLPEKAPEICGLEVVGSSESALEVGGDYYDLIRLDENRIAVAVGDVAGKGVNAAMIMAMTKSCLYNQIHANHEVVPMMEALNGMITEAISMQKQRRTTFIYAIIDGKERTMTYACAGHQPPHYFNSAKGMCESLPIPGSYPLGVRANAKYKEVTVPLNPGDVLVFYTDGVTEAMDPAGNNFYRIEEINGEEVEIDLLRETIEKNREFSPLEIRLAIRKNIEEFVDGGPQTDDITMVVVKVGE
jgi:sigma-B regulation protein RsbU (phosphoserine phosphatase)